MTYNPYRVRDVIPSGDATGATDYANINAAMAAISARGGEVRLHADNGGLFQVNGAINMGNGGVGAVSTRAGMALVGDGYPADYIGSGSGVGGGGTQFGSVSLKYVGASLVGALLNVKGPLGGWAIRNLHLDCNALADIAIKNTSGMWGECRQIVAQGFRTQGYFSTTVPSFGGRVCNAMHNEFDNVALIINDYADNVGVFCDGEALASTNTCYDSWRNLYIVGNGITAGHTVYPFQMKTCDNVKFDGVHLTRALSGGTFIPIVLDQRGGRSDFPADCVWSYIDFGSSTDTAAVRAGLSTNNPRNPVRFISRCNGTPADPAIAELPWTL